MLQGYSRQRRTIGSFLATAGLSLFVLELNTGAWPIAHQENTRSPLLVQELE